MPFDPPPDPDVFAVEPARVSSGRAVVAVVVDADLDLLDPLAPASVPGADCVVFNFTGGSVATTADLGSDGFFVAAALDDVDDVAGLDVAAGALSAGGALGAMVALSGFVTPEISA